MNALHNSPDLRRLQFLGQPSREAVAPYLTMLKARHYAPKTIQATIGMLKAFCARLPPAHQAGPPSANTRKFTVSHNDFFLKDLQRPWIAIKDAYGAAKDGGTNIRA
jgi:hypothetical protein